MKRTLLFIFIGLSLAFIVVKGQMSLHKLKDFDSMMGGEKLLTKHILTTEDRDNFSAYKMTDANPKTAESIPHTFHFVWLHSYGMSKDITAHIKAFLRKHPGWTCKIWSETLKKSPVKGAVLQKPDLTSLKRQYLSETSLEAKAFMVALEALKKEGGVYLDVRLKSVSALTPLTQGRRFFGGISPLKEPSLGSSVHLNEKIIGSVPSHPILLSTIAGIQENTDFIKIAYSTNSLESSRYRFFHSLYKPFETALQMHLESEKPSVFPTAYFEDVGEEKSLFTTLDPQIATLSDLGRFEKMMMQHLLKLSKRSNQFLFASILLLLLTGILTSYAIYRFKTRA